LSTKSFTLKDQLAFAELSGDHNPMHIDPIEARRTIFGEPVVHGIHGLLWALAQYEQISIIALKDLKGNFHKPITLNTEVTCKWEKLGNLKFAVKISTADKLFTSLQVTFQDHYPAPEHRITSSSTITKPDRISIEDCHHAKGKLTYRWNKKIAQQLFPNLDHYQHLNHLSFLLTSTELVGMKCPGYDSLYSSIQVSFGTKDDSNLFSEFEIQKVDPRFNLIFLDLHSSNIQANIKAFFRPRPTPVISIEQAQTHVLDQEFKNQKALIIGGSRGLGATTAKLLKAGGADVTITYAKGKKEAQSMYHEFKQKSQELTFFQCDLSGSDNTFQNIPKQNYTHIYYFASPKIKPNESKNFDSELYQHFKHFYHTQFERCINYFNSDQLKVILFPSTVYIDEQPQNMREYIKAKIEGETFCRKWGASHTKVELHTPRYPKLATDQTADIKDVDLQSPVEVIYDSLPKN
jgi:predicted DNA-binding WGR domain protein